MGPRPAISHSWDRDNSSHGPVFLQRDPYNGASGTISIAPAIALAKWKAYVERALIGLDPPRNVSNCHMIVFGEMAHLRRVLRGYGAYYNGSRNPSISEQGRPSLHSRHSSASKALSSHDLSLAAFYHQYCRI